MHTVTLVMEDNLKCPFEPSHAEKQHMNTNSSSLVQSRSHLPVIRGPRILLNVILVPRENLSYLAHNIEILTMQSTVGFLQTQTVF